MYRNSKFARRQRGFLMPLTLFLVVAAAALAVAMSRAGGTGAVSTTQQSLSAQALYAADSGAQYALHRLLWNSADRTEVDNRCAALHGSSLTFDTVGLAGCRASFRCGVAADSSGSANYYTIDSAATCGGGQLMAAREISVSTYF